LYHYHIESCHFWLTQWLSHLPSSISDMQYTIYNIQPELLLSAVCSSIPEGNLHRPTSQFNLYNARWSPTSSSSLSVSISISRFFQLFQLRFGVNKFSIHISCGPRTPDSGVRSLEPDRRSSLSCLLSRGGQGFGGRRSWAVHTHSLIYGHPWPPGLIGFLRTMANYRAFYPARKIQLSG